MTSAPRTNRFQPAFDTLTGYTLPDWATRESLAFYARLGVPSPSHNELRQMHFATYKRLREGFALEIRAALGRTPPMRLQRAGLVVVRHCQGKGLDWGNALGGIKPIEDCLTRPSPRSPNGLHIIEDDDVQHMPHCPVMLQMPARRGQGFTELYLFDVSNTTA